MSAPDRSKGHLDGNVAIVTGGAQGLGLGIVCQLVSDGAQVVIADVRQPEASLLDQLGAKVTRAQCDVSDSHAVDTLVHTTLERFGRLDIMVANAGIGGGGPVVDLPDDWLRRILAVNLEGSFYCCRAAARAMIPAGTGVIITVGSIFGRDTPIGSAAYGASKAGVMALTAALARELGPHNIRVNCISPGNMATDMHWRALQRRADRDDVPIDALVDRLRAEIPMRRHGEPEDIGALVSFLASAGASYITGQTINVDGGYQPR